MLQQRRYTAYEYDSSLPAQSIRLLRIDGWSYGVLRGSLESVPLAKCPPYTALSYTWSKEDPGAGSFMRNFWRISEETMGETWLHRNRISTYTDTDSTSRLIICDDKLLSISQNLYDGLTTILATDQHTDQFWWIDQVCIDQANEAEKSSQVMLMDKIYKQASSVAAWLGHGSAWEISGLKSIYKLIEGPPNGDNDDFSWIMDCTCLYFALASIARRTYFRRVWTIQEQLLAKDLTFFVSNHAIAYDDLYEAANKAAIMCPPIGQARIFEQVFGFHELARLLGQRKHFQNGGLWTIEEWLAAVRGHSAFDDRDYLYAGLALLSRSDRARIVVDYSLSRADVFMDLTHDLLMNGTGINTLSLAEQGLRFDDAPGPERPTWEINADRPTFRTPMQKLVYGRPSACPPSVSEAFEAEYGMLSTKAILLDELDVVCSEALLDTGEGIEDLLKIILAMGAQYSWTGEHPLIALATTIVADAGDAVNWQSRIPEICQNTASFVATLAEFSKVWLVGQRPMTVDPLARLKDWPLYKDFNWDETWIRLGVMPGTPLTAVSVDTLGIFAMITAATRRRRLFMTKNGIIGLGPVTAKQGQKVAIVAGANVPYILNSVALGRLEKYLDPWDKSCVERAKRIQRSHPNTASTLVWHIVWNNIWQGVQGAEPFVEIMTRPELEKYYRDTRTTAAESMPFENTDEMDRIRSSKQLVGEAYLHGFMHGEVEKWMDEKGFSWQNIDLQ